MKKQRKHLIIFVCLLLTLIAGLWLGACEDETDYLITFDNNISNKQTFLLVQAGSGITLPSTLPYQIWITKYGYTFVGWNTSSSGTGTNYDVGQNFKPNGDITLYAVWKEIDSTPLTVNEWANGSIASNNGEVWYSFNVISGTTYYIWWNDVNQGDSTKTANVSVYAGYSGGSAIFADNNSPPSFVSRDSAWTSPQSFTANMNGTVKLRVIPSNNTTAAIGTFAVVYSTVNTRPGNTSPGGTGGISQIWGIAYGNGKFVAVATPGMSGAIAYSADGVTWTATTSHPFGDGSIYGVAWGADKFVAVGSGSDDKSMIAYSADGVTWTKVTTAISSPDKYVSSIVWGADKFVIGGQSGMSYSADGISWTAISNTNNVFNGYIEAIGWGDGKFVAGSTSIAYSTDGIAWAKVANANDPFGVAMIDGSANGGNIRDFAWGNNKHIVVGNYGPLSNMRGRIAYSSDAESWTAVADNTFGTTTVSAVAYGNGKYVAGGVSDGKMAYSSDGVTWTAVTDSKFGTAGIYDIVYGGGKFVAVGHQSRIAYSADGITWTAVADSPFN